MTNPARQTGEYGRWSSPLTPGKIFLGSESISFARPAGKGVFFLLSLPEEGNAQVLMHMAPSGKPCRVTPPGVNVRSRVHEYGGLPYAFDEQAVYYCNFKDQRLLRQPFDQGRQCAGDAVPLSPVPAHETAQLRYGDFVVDAPRGRLIGVREDHREKDGEARNALVGIDLQQGGEGDILYAQSDFVSSPRLSPDGGFLAFQTWSHPCMPWDRTEIQLARFAGSGGLAESWQVAEGRAGSLLQPLFSSRGDLYFIADWSDWWNLYRLPAESLRQGGEAEAVLPLPAEFCPAQWQLGQHHFAFRDERHLLVSINRQGFWDLVLLDLEERRLSPLRQGLGSLDDVNCESGSASYLAATPTRPAALYSREPAEPQTADRILFSPRHSALLPADSVSLPEHISYPTEGGEAHGLFYAPRNPAWQAPEGSLPPLLVCVHGGPTSSARTSYNPSLQFWTTRGFAVLDVNHRGSTGYGRRYRQQLYGRWGEADVVDVIQGVRHLIAQGRVAPDRVVIRGGSAGGYVVLAALAESDIFRAGTSYYGISDLESLARDTHKFESRYLEQLIGPLPDALPLYRARSPLHRIEHIRSPVLLLQGMEDKVVPPSQAEEIHRRLLRQNVASRLIRFEDEGHGFRKPENQIKALQAELDFYREVLG